MATEFTVEEAQERLAELLDRTESGEEIVITRFGVPSVTLAPASSRRRTQPVTAGGAEIAGGVIGAFWATPTDGGGQHHQHATDGTDTFDMGTDFWSPDPGAA